MARSHARRFCVGRALYVGGDDVDHKEEEEEERGKKRINQVRRAVLASGSGKIEGKQQQSERAYLGAWSRRSGEEEGRAPTRGAGRCGGVRLTE